MGLYCWMCGRSAVPDNRLCSTCLASIRKGVKEMKEGRVRPWKEVEAELFNKE